MTRGPIPTVPPGLSRRAISVRRPSPTSLPALRDELLGGVEWTVPFVGLLLYTVAIITYAIPTGSAGMLLALVGIPFQKGRLRFPGMVILGAAFMAWSLLGLGFSAYEPAVSEAVWSGWKLWLILFVAVNAIRTRQQAYLFLCVLVGAYTLYPMRGALFNFWIYGEAYRGRAIWKFIFDNPNDLASFTILMLSVALAIQVEARHRLIKTGALAVTVAFPIMILLTQSRGAFIALAWFGALSFSLKRRARNLALVALIAALALALVPSDLWNRVEGLRGVTNVERLDEVDSTGSAEERFEIWRSGFAMFWDHPFTGVGLGGYADAMPLYSQRVIGRNLGRRDSHGTYVGALAQTGIPGLLLFLAFLGAPILYAERVRRAAAPVLPARARQVYLLEVGFVSYLIAGLFGTYILLAFTYVHAALLWAMARLCEGELRGAQPALVMRRPKQGRRPWHSRVQGPQQPHFGRG